VSPDLQENASADDELHGRQLFAFLEAQEPTPMKIKSYFARTVEDAMAQAREELGPEAMLVNIIDTPGFGFGEMDHSAPLAGFLAARSDIDTQLVLSSSMKSADLTRVVNSYESFRPQRLLFTKLDETGSFGSILNETVRTGKPLSFFANGQRIPEDLETASRSRVSKLVFAGHPARALSAA
jgi:flagellar biosynthesis protein FlhF